MWSSILVVLPVQITDCEVDLCQRQPEGAHGALSAISLEWDEYSTGTAPHLGIVRGGPHPDKHRVMGCVVRSERQRGRSSLRPVLVPAGVMAKPVGG